MRAHGVRGTACARRAQALSGEAGAAAPDNGLAVMPVDLSNGPPSRPPATLRLRRSARYTSIAPVLVFVASCGTGGNPDPTVVPISDWPAADATVVCARIFGCCGSSDISGFGYPDELACRASIARDEQARVSGALSLGGAVYDEHAARRCLDEAMALSCVDFFPEGRPALSGPSCAMVFQGVGRAGDACSVDADCESADCDVGHCVVPPCSNVICAAGQYCDPMTKACVPAKLAGALCAADVECDPLLGCHDGTCGPTLAVGVACGKSSDCTAGSCQPAPTTPPTSVCVPPLPDGSSCSIRSECASGGCSFTAATGKLVCGPIVCAGGA